MTALTTAHRGDRIGLGIVLILFSTLMTASQDATFKFASSEMTIWQIYVIRSTFLIPALLATAVIWGTSGGIWSAALKPWPVARSFMFVMMYFSMFSVLPFLQLAIVAAGLYTAPLWVAALSPFLLGEPVNFRKVLAIAFGFCGVLVNLRPGTDAFSWFILLPVMAGLFYALSSIITRSKCRHIAPTALAISLALALLVTGAVGSLVIMLLQPSSSVVALSPFLLNRWAELGPLEWSVIAILTGIMFVNGLVLPAAYQAAPTVIIATFDYCYLIFSPLLGFLLFSQTPDFYTILGMCMIAGAGLVIVQKPEGRAWARAPSPQQQSQEHSPERLFGGRLND